VRFHRNFGEISLKKIGIIEKFAQENNRVFANKMMILMDQKVSSGGVPLTPLITKETATIRPRASSSTVPILVVRNSKFPRLF
jgi:hypothetical protein